MRKGRQAGRTHSLVVKRQAMDKFVDGMAFPARNDQPTNRDTYTHTPTVSSFTGVCAKNAVNQPPTTNDKRSVCEDRPTEKRVAATTPTAATTPENVRPGIVAWWSLRPTKDDAQSPSTPNCPSMLSPSPSAAGTDAGSTLRSSDDKSTELKTHAWTAINTSVGLRSASRGRGTCECRQAVRTNSG